jgi:predicted acylesterase/phospholipase RssA
LLWAAVRSSMSVAGVLPPMWHGKDRLLCDGGYVDNLPISIMRASPFSPGSIIAVDLEDRGKQAEDGEDDALKAIYRQSEFNDCAPFTHISGWRCLWDSLKFWKQAPKIPTLLDIMKGLTGINHSRNVRMQLATMRDEKNLNFLFLEVESVYQFKLLDYDKLDEIASHCFEFSSLRIAKWMSELKAKQQQRQPIKRAAAMNANKSYLALDTLIGKLEPDQSKSVSPATSNLGPSKPNSVSPPKPKPSMVRSHSVFFRSDAS